VGAERGTVDINLRIGEGREYHNKFEKRKKLSD
jgi:hypothetical protein